MSRATSRRAAPRRRTSGHSSPPSKVATSDIAGRRRRLAHARRHFEAFEAANRYQSELEGTALAMISYLEDRWRVPGWPADFDRWWRILGRYARVLASGELAGPGARKRLERVLNENQQRPSNLQERWLNAYGRKRRSSQNRLKSAPVGLLEVGA